MMYTTLIDVASLAALRTAAAAQGDARGAGNAPAAAPPLLLLDCRFELAAADAGRHAYIAARIPGARYADLNRDLSAAAAPGSGRHPLPSPAALARFFAFDIGDDTQVVAYDETNGSFAARAWWLLRWLGHARVAVLDGGFKAWVALGGAVESGEPGAPPPPAATFVPRPAGAAVCTAAEVQRALQDPRRLLVDARAAERFAGTVEPLDSVAGHVPGAVNHSFQANLAADGRFLPPAELRRRWQERLGGRDPADTILMCGSGVTACHNALAMEIAGLPGAHLYAGSWSEWIRDPSRPVTRGSDP